MDSQNKTVPVILLLACGFGTAAIVIFVFALESGNKAASIFLSYLLRHAGWVIGSLVLFSFGLVVPLFVRGKKGKKT